KNLLTFTYSKNNNMRKILVCGAGGFIGGHLVKKLKREGHWVRGVDLKRNDFSPSPADEFIIGDLTNQQLVNEIVDTNFDEIYQLA
ncbi:NAD-dependent epimerase/dehydratase family protein, partial [Acinetobacter baumannii]